MTNILSEKDAWTLERIEILRADAERWRKKAETLEPGEERLNAVRESAKADKMADTIAIWLHSEAAQKKLESAERRADKSADKLPPPKKDWQRLYAGGFQAYGLPNPECEHRPEGLNRRWALDFAWPDFKVALEIQGGAWIGKGHGKPQRQAEDREKLNTLQIAGWIVLQCDPRELRSMAVIPFVKGAIEARQLSRTRP